MNATVPRFSSPFLAPPSSPTRDSARGAGRPLGGPREVGLTRVDRALRKYPRSVFLPPVVAWADEHGAWQRVNQRDTPGAWLRAARSDEPLITAWGALPGEQVPRSVVPGPPVVRRICRQAGLSARSRVVHIGSTGWVPALLSELGMQVTTVEDHRDAAASTAAHLHAQRAPVRVTHTHRAPEAEPFDHVLATCAVRGHIPFPLLALLRPRGTAFLPFGFGDWHVLTRIGLTEDRTGTGRFTVPLGRSRIGWAAGHHPPPTPTLPAVPPGTGRHLPLPPAFWPRDRFPLGLWIAGLRLPHCCAHPVLADESGHRVLTLQDTTPGAPPSLSRLTLRDNGGATLTTLGPRDLGEELLAAYQWWESVGRPGLDRLALTVTPTGGTSATLTGTSHRWLLPSHPTSSSSPNGLPG